jgi:ribosomal protein L22
MVEVLLKKKVLEELIELEDFVILEELTTVEEDHEMVKVELEEKPLKKALLKLLKKAKYNAKYLEEMVDVNKVKRNILYRNYRLF